ncbi:high-potential iron-sulfur protein [Sulfuriflexus sp.]|uniref:high-potential iron-sulfur protein n=1 Tax=Sulfuriflexus sp. TaxID=2015443 RepID=UPI0028CC8A40|nr:high-potential iron-sulfur protein [Sulfuriflexus sp.]MDT8405147.1 high-potential iron-sulfur protein [Sulfuriflexus sp.]
MQKKIANPQRRRALFTIVAGVASIPFVKIMSGGQAQAAGLPHLSEDDLTAKVLKYHHDASAAPRVDKYGVAAKDQFCHNCALVQSDSGDWRPCQIFPGKAVNANGWCTSWTKQQG